MASPTRADLEAAARRHFEDLARRLDHPRDLGRGAEFYPQVEQQLSHTEDRIEHLDRQIISHAYEGDIRNFARDLIVEAGGVPDEVDPQVALLAQQLTARAIREQMRLLIHQLSTPIAAFDADDPLFRGVLSGTSWPTNPPQQEPTPRISSPKLASEFSLQAAAEEYLRKKAARRVSQSQVDETARLLGWLQQELGAERPVATVSRAELKKFRDDLQRIDVTLRGRPGQFRDRLTNVAAHQVVSATYLRYWNAARGFFGWCRSEDYIADDPTAGLVIEKKLGETKRTPPPFSRDELLALFATPLFAGHKSSKRLKTPGARLVRDGHWWAAVLLMHTGLRAGELSQLGHDDFVFEGEIPHLKVRQVNDAGEKVKTTKNDASVRDVPLHPDLITLGLREFVAAGRKSYPKARTFREFRLGQRGRISDGMTRFWSDYLHEFGLWKEGRSTHVWRHTLIACLRANEVAEEDIGALVGHTGRTITSAYGGVYPLARKARTLEALDYNFDTVAALGGPFDPKRHHHI